MDNEANARWLSYDEIADMRGIDRASAIRMVRRKQWPKQDANDGTTRVSVPGAFFRARRTKAAAPGQGAPKATGLPPGNDNENAPSFNALSEHVRTLREQLAAAATREERLCGELIAVEAWVDKAREETAAERARAALAECEREAARIAAAAAEGEAKGLQVAVTELREALAEARRPFWRRWIG
jgi:hypothetical protein